MPTLRFGGDPPGAGDRRPDTPGGVLRPRRPQDADPVAREARAERALSSQPLARDAASGESRDDAPPHHDLARLDVAHEVDAEVVGEVFRRRGVEHHEVGLLARSRGCRCGRRGRGRRRRSTSPRPAPPRSVRPAPRQARAMIGRHRLGVRGTGVAVGGERDRNLGVDQGAAPARSARAGRTKRPAARRPPRHAWRGPRSRRRWRAAGATRRSAPSSAASFAPPRSNSSSAWRWIRHP